MLRIKRTRRRDERGFSLVLLSLVLVSLLGVAGLVVDLGSWQVEASRIQQAADAAALAGVVQLPDGVPAADSRARAVAKDNGYDQDLDGDDDPTVTIQVRPINAETLEVTITKTGIPQYFTGVFRGPTTITRRATAQFVQPVPMGSPRNYLGTGNLLAGHPGVSGDGVENFWLAVSNQCTKREYGDRIAPRAMNIPGSVAHNCDPSLAPRMPNPEHPADGAPSYFFGVTVPDVAGAYPVDIQMFDAPVCNTPSSLAGDENAAVFDVNVKVRSDGLDPRAAPILTDQTFIGGRGSNGHCGQGPARDDCADLPAARPLPPALNLRDCWTTIATLTEAGDYYVQVSPLALADLLADSRHDQFSLRAAVNGSFVPCTGDPAVRDEGAPAVAWSESCTNIYGIEHLPVFANQSGANPVFFLASIDERHNNKTMQVTLYDTGEGAQFIELLNPNGAPETFEWEVLCADGSTHDGACPQGDRDPTGGWGGRGALDSTNKLPVSGSGTTTFPNNTQTDKYSDRMLRLTVKLPDDIADEYGGRTWWKIRYTCGGCGDRTTWSVRLLGDPVRLVPNAPPPAAPED